LNEHRSDDSLPMEWPTSAKSKGESPRDKLALNERLTILLKEYDALRKEAEQSLALMPEIGKSIGLVIAGALIGATRDSFGQEIVLCAPPVIMAALGAVSHTHAKLEATSRRLMLIEEQVFEMAGEPLLRQETRMNMRRKGRGGHRWMFAAVIGTVLYLVGTVMLFDQFREPFATGSSGTWIVLYWFIVGAAGSYASFSAFRIGWQRRHIPETQLLQLEQDQSSVQEKREIDSTLNTD
jgi:hypothetical protein